MFSFRAFVSKCVFVVIAANSLDALAQQQVWRHISNKGMTNTNITCMASDASGFLYFGTQEGVDVYDGRRFQPITLPHSMQKGINPYVNSLQWDARGILWVATRNHIYNYNAATGDAHVPKLDPPYDNVTAMAIDTGNSRLYFARSGYIYVCKIRDTELSFLYKVNCNGSINRMVLTADRDLAIVRNSDQLLRMRDSTVRLVFTTNQIKDVVSLPLHKSIVVLSSDGLVVINGYDQRPVYLRATTDWDLKAGISHLTVIDNDRLLFHNTYGLHLLHHLTDTFFTHFVHDEKNPCSIQSNFISVAFSDRRRNIWVAEEGTGISVLPSSSFHMAYFSSGIVGGTRAWRLYNDSAHHQLLASSESGLCVIKPDEGKVSLRAQIRPPGLSFFEVIDYSYWGDNELLVLTNGQGLWLFNTVTYTYRPCDVVDQRNMPKGIFGLYALHQNDYLLYGSRGIFRFKKGDSKMTELRQDNDSAAGTFVNKTVNFYVYCMMRDKANRLWLGSSKGIKIVDTGFSILKKYGGNMQARNAGLTNTIVMDIKQQADGTVYVGTMGGGAYRLTGHDTFASVPLAGAPGVIYCVGIIDSAHILFTTSKGMWLYDSRSGQSALINENNGMPITDFNQYGLYTDNSFVLAAGAKGVVMTATKDLLAGFRDTAQLQLMQGTTALHDILLQQGVTALDLDIAITGYANAADWKIQYKLEGVDDDWRAMEGNDRHLHFNSLVPGAYRLVVQATDNQGVVWVNPVAVNVTALPFFWQTVWFRIILLGLCLGLIIVTVRFFSRQSLKWQLKKMEDEQKVSKERLRISRELHDNVGSQLTYLISGLESSGILLQRQESGLLEKKIEHMQDSARESMQQLRDAIWALNNENVAASLLLARFEVWLTKITESFPGLQAEVNGNVQHDILLDPVKSLGIFRIMQEAVHNVLKHADASTLVVSFFVDKQTLNISIKDNGKGFDNRTKEGFGTRSMTTRAEEMAATRHVVSEVGKGTEVVLHLDIK